MGIYCEHSILEKCKTNSEFLEKLLDTVLGKRPQTEIVYNPYTKRPWENVDWPDADLTKLYPDYEEGDYAYFGGFLDGEFEREMLINIRNCSSDSELWFNGEKTPIKEAPSFNGRDEGSFDAEVTFRKGQNSLLLKVYAKKDLFGGKVIPLIPGVRKNPDNYEYCSWLYMDMDGFNGQRGIKISRLYKKGEPCPDAENIEWKYPEKPLQSNEKDFDFDTFCDRGSVAYSYTYVKGEINLTHSAPITVFENGKEVYCENSGEFTANYEKETELLIRSRKDKNRWGFKAVTKGENSLPFVIGADCPDLQWMWIGPFGLGTDGKFQPYGPECNLQFDSPYSSIHGPVYWHFYRKDTTLVQSVTSAFFGQWCYPQMLGLRGIKSAADKLGREKEIFPYFSEWMKIFSKCIDYGKYERVHNGSWSRFMTPAGRLDNLDSIGTIGINLADYCMMSGDSDAKYLLQLLAERISHNVPRFPDGTFYRIKTMWTDDTFMCMPFLVRLGAMMGDVRCFDDILTQVRGFVKRLWMEEEELFSHIYFVEQETPNRIPWGRGNGWVLLALSEVLLMMPKEYHGYDEILDVYKKFAKGVLRHWNKETGLWHQVVNNHASYAETSGSAMFITGLARGIRMGWIDKGAQETVEKAWNSLLRNCVDDECNVFGVCMGSGCSMDEEYYINLGTITNDDHGVGIVLGTCVEVINMLEEN